MASQKAPLPTFPGQVEQVTVDVVVTDKKGVPLTGLGKDDLEVFEDGVRQTVVSFEAVQVPAVASTAPPPRPRLSTNQERQDVVGRTFVVLFDDVHLSASTAHLAKGAVADFLGRGVREGDRVTLVATLAGTWCSARMESGRDELVALVKRLDGLYIPDTSRERMTDYEAMRIHVNRDVEVAQRVQRRFTELGVAQAQNPGPSQSRFLATSVDPYVESRAAEMYAQSTGRNRKTLAILERSLEALGATKGRKSLILISEGFIYDSSLREFKWVAEAARRANTAVYFVNAKGLEGMPFSLTAQFGGALPAQDVGFALTEGSWEVEGAEAIASDSGGFSVRDTNDLSGGVKRIADENSSYYLLGYNPTNPARDGAFRKITVKLAGRKGLEVRARKGYYAPSDDPGAAPPRAAVDPVFQKALDSPYDIGDIPLRMTEFVGEETTLGKARVDVVTEVDLRAVALEARGALRGRRRVPARGGPPRERGALPLRPEGRAQAPPRHPGSGWRRPGSPSAASSSCRRGPTRRRSWCATCARAGWRRWPTGSRYRSSASSASPPPCSPTTPPTAPRVPSRPPGGAARVRAGGGALVPVRRLPGGGGPGGRAEGVHGLRTEARGRHRS